MGRGKSLEVEIAYLGVTRQFNTRLQVPYGTSLRGVIERSRLCELFPEIDLTINRVGVFGMLCDLGAPVREGDRVEVYRPLNADPKVARRQRSLQGSRPKTPKA